MSNPVTQIEISKLRELIRELKKLDSSYVREFYQDARDIAKPVQKIISDAIPNTPPISGMRAKSYRARLGWNIGKRVKGIKVRVNRTVRRKSSFAQGKINTYPIVQVYSDSPALVMSDMAGKKNKSVPRSRKYEINLFGRGVIVERTHKVNGQGKAMIQALTAVKGGPSRWFWPAALLGLDGATKKMQLLINKTNEIINRRLGT